MTSKLLFFQLFLILILFFTTQAQSAFVSETDEAMTIRKIALITFTDNVKGIYSIKLQEAIHAKIQNTPRLSLVEHSLNLKSNQIELDRAEIKKVMKTLGVDSLLTCHLTRGPKGINSRLILFVGSEGYEFNREVLVDSKNFSTEAAIQDHLTMLNKLIKKIPYDGLVMSRKNLDVTINLGSDDGLTSGDIVHVIQFTKVKRHPKLNHFISADQFVLGKLKIIKVEPTLSFATIQMERSQQSIQPNNKIIKDDFKDYKKNSPLNNQTELDDRLESKATFGKNPVEWKPLPSARFGQIQFYFGLSDFNQTTDLNNSINYSLAYSYNPKLEINGEIWLNPDWWLTGSLNQSVITAANGYSGSSPGSINISTQYYDLAMGYRFYFFDTLNGAFANFGIGLSEKNINGDTTSPVAITNTKSGGLFTRIGLQNSFFELAPISAFVNFDWFLTPKTSESGLTSGSSNSTSISHFSLGLKYHNSNGQNYLFKYRTEYINTSFAGLATRGASANSISTKNSDLLFGIEYGF